DTTLLPRFTLTLYFLYSLIRPPPTSTLFPYTTLFRSTHARHRDQPEQIMVGPSAQPVFRRQSQRRRQQHIDLRVAVDIGLGTLRSEEHTSELQSRGHLVCRLLLEKKKRKKIYESAYIT